LKKDIQKGEEVKYVFVTIIVAYISIAIDNDYRFQNERGDSNEEWKNDKNIYFVSLYFMHYFLGGMQ
jgi:endo-alpha-1,4-polygalactosaminidase (GH114 family)